ISYSKESDYKSVGLSLNYAFDFNQKNTTLNLGVSQNFDQVIFTPNTDDPALFGKTAYRNNTDFLVGINQLLDPKTALTANVSLGTDSGDLNDPYRQVYFQDFLPQTVPTLFPEIRPRHRLKEVAYLSLTHFVTPVDASVEGSYRFYHDSFGIYGNTVSVAWLQKLGNHLVLSPSFRFYQQTAASFYVTCLPANVEDPQLASIGPPSSFGFTSGPPTYYSSDYRLSSFVSFTYGMSATWKINQHVYF